MKLNAISTPQKIVLAQTNSRPDDTGPVLPPFAHSPQDQEACRQVGNTGRPG